MSKKKTPLAKGKASPTKPSAQRIEALTKAAEQYGQRAFDNYAQIRSVAESLRDGFCEWLDNTEQCVFLVPPKGDFIARNYGSAAFSVSGSSFLALAPIAFGLAVKISTEDDYMRLTLIARKEGERMFLSQEKGEMMSIHLPIAEADLTPIFETLFEDILHRFTGAVDHYDNGDYGGTDIGFDIQRVTEKSVNEDPKVI